MNSELLMMLEFHLVLRMTNQLVFPVMNILSVRETDPKHQLAQSLQTTMERWLVLLCSLVIFVIKKL